MTGRYLLLSLELLVQPWKWRRGKSRSQLQSSLKHWFDAECTLFGSGREALLALLRSLDFPKGSEIIIQGFTCVALPNAIHASGYTPVYADIDPTTLNLDPTAVQSAITPRTKAIICQHTFGIVADTKTLRTIADSHGLLFIEDCAHVLPDVTGPKSIGMLADALLLSFGRDKAVSGVAGGAVLTRRADLAEVLGIEEDLARELPLLSIKLLLLYPLLYAICKPLYRIGIGKGLLWLCAKLGVLPPVITVREKDGYQSPLLRKMPNACAALVLAQLKRFHTINNHRRKLTTLYLEASSRHHFQTPSGLSEHFPLQKFPIFVSDADQVRKRLKAKNIYLDDGWTGTVVCPRNANQAHADYVQGSCPNAESIARRILTLPTHPTMTEKQAKMLVAILSTFIS